MFVKTLSVVISVIAFAGCSSFSEWTLREGQHPQRFEKQITQTVGAKFLLYLPKSFTAESKPWPLIVFLHGSGERGDDLEKVKLHGPPKLMENQEEFPFIVVSPQCPEDSRWSVEILHALLNEVIDRLPIDTDRVYLTGLSMGGFGTWNFALAYPNRFAAIAPICGGGTLDGICRLKNIPVWAFHGAKDEVVKVVESERMIEALKRCGGEAQLTVYPGVGHDSWSETYANHELYKWFLEHKRKPTQGK